MVKVQWTNVEGGQNVSQSITIANSDHNICTITLPPTPTLENRINTRDQNLKSQHEVVFKFNLDSLNSYHTTLINSKNIYFQCQYRQLN